MNARQARRPWQRVVQLTGDPEQDGFLAHPADQLDSDRQPVGGHGQRQAQGRLPGRVEENGKGAQREDLARPAVGVERGIVGVQHPERVRRRRDRRGEQEVIAGEKVTDASAYLVDDRASFRPLEGS